MYEKFYGFREKPFSLTPDPKFFYLSPDHLEALEHLIYGISQGEGFMLLIGEIGTGKTTLSRVLTERLGQSVLYSLILNPFQDFFDLLRNILWDFGVIPEAASSIDLLNQLVEFLLHEVGPKGKTALIIIDEAQNLTSDTLEQLRVISNIETDKEKLLQILLLGQEELMGKLKARSLRQLNQRISVRYYLSPLSRTEVGHYLDHRIQVGHAERPIIFDPGAIRAIYRFSRGIPRLINMVANRCLIGGFVQETSIIDKGIVKRAVESLFGEKFKKISRIPQKEMMADPPNLPEEE